MTHLNTWRFVHMYHQGTFPVHLISNRLLFHHTQIARKDRKNEHAEEDGIPFPPADKNGPTTMLRLAERDLMRSVVVNALVAIFGIPTVAYLAWVSYTLGMNAWLTATMINVAYLAGIFAIANGILFLSQSVAVSCLLRDFNELHAEVGALAYELDPEVQAAKVKEHVDHKFADNIAANAAACEDAALVEDSTAATRRSYWRCQIFLLAGSWNERSQAGEDHFAKMMEDPPPSPTCLTCAV